MDYTNCNLCPRGCGVDRTAGQFGYCRCPATALVVKTMLHRWEEPALAPGGKSGAVFFGGCTLGCKYCQNAAISGGAVGKAVTSAQLRQLFEDLIAQGAENIDLVNAKSIMGIMAFNPSEGMSIDIVTDGLDEEEAVLAIEKFLVCE